MSKHFPIPESGCKVSVFWTVRTADSTASDTAASDTINAGLDMTSSNIAGILSPGNTVVTANWNRTTASLFTKENNFMEEKVKAFSGIATQKKPLIYLLLPVVPFCKN